MSGSDPAVAVANASKYAEAPSAEVAEASRVQAMADALTLAHQLSVKGERLTLDDVSDWTGSYKPRQRSRDVNAPHVQSLRKEFAAVTGSVGTPMTPLEFAKALQTKSQFLATILFERMDHKSTNTLSCDDFVDSMLILRHGTVDDRLSFAFRLYDIDQSGAIEKADIVKMLRVCLEENRMKLDDEQLARMASGMMNTLDADHDGALSPSDFAQIESKYPGLALLHVGPLKPPPMLVDARTPKTPKTPGAAGTPSSRILAKISKGFSAPTPASSNRPQVRQRKDSWMSAGWYWARNNPQQIGCMLVILAMFAAAFYITAETFCVFQGMNCDHTNTDLYALFGPGLAIAKGSAGATKVAFAIIIFPVCRNTITVLRETFLRKLIPFDDAITWHKIIAGFGLLFSAMHTFAHVSNFHRLSSEAYKREFQWVFGWREPQPTAAALWSTAPAITGLVMCSILLVAYLFAAEWPRRASWLKDTAVGKVLNNFNNFAMTHCLFLVFYLCFIFHAFPKPYGYGDMWCWVAIPVGIYLVEKVIKCWRRRTPNVEILEAALMPGSTIHLKMSKPSGFTYLSGQYVFINFPELARMEWHPFTLTSAPDDEFISLQIRAVGDWTCALQSMIQDVTDRRERALDVDLEAGAASNPLHAANSPLPGLPPFPRVHVDGPFGAPAQTWQQYRTVVMVGAGIGVTPCASVLRDVLNNIKQPVSGAKGRRCATQKVHFFWCTRDREEATWFRHELESIALIDVNQVLDINIHITSLKSDSGLTPNFLKLGQMTSHLVHGKDVMTGMETNFITKFGRPDWNGELTKVAQAHSEGQPEGGRSGRVGVFYCGPVVLAKSINQTCATLNTEKALPAKFDFYQEHF
eukprot:jgi/Tetstr1/421763/TSEL_012667.t1